MAGLLDGFMNPTTMGLLGMAQGFGQAAGPSRMPVPLGAAFGAGAGGFMEAMTAAQKMKLMQDQAKRLEMQTQIQQAELDHKKQQWEQQQKLLPQITGALTGGGMPAGFGGGGEEMAPQPGQIPGNPDAAPAGGFYSTLRGAESGGRVDAANPRSSARGPDQFIDGTWLAFAKANPQHFQGMDQMQILSARTDPKLGPVLSGEATKWYAGENAKALAAAGLPANDFTVALGHRFGPGDAIKLLKADPNTPAASILSGAVLRANPGLGPATVGAILRPLQGQFGTGQTFAASAQPASGGAGEAAPAPPINSVPPPVRRAFGNVAERAYQQYRQTMSAAAMAGQAGLTHMVGPLTNVANKYLELGAWQQGSDPATGRTFMVNALTGERKFDPDVQLTKVNQINPQTGQMEVRQVPNAMAAGMRGVPDPGAAQTVLGPNGPRMVDANNPNRVIGTPMLTGDQISTLPYQPGAAPAAPAPNIASPGSTPAAPTPAAQADAFNASMARRIGDEAFRREEGQSSAKAAEALMTQRNTAYDNIRKLDQFAGLMNDFTTGKFAGAKITIGQVLQAAQIPDSVLPAGIDRKAIASAETMTKITNELAMGLVGPGGMPANNFSEADRNFVVATVNNVQNTPGGNAKVLELAKAVEQRKLAIGDGWAKWREEHGSSATSYQRFEAQEIPKIKAATPLAPSGAAAGGGEQQNQQAGPRRISNSAEYEAVPKGATYIDPMGIPRVKK